MRNGFDIILGAYIFADLAVAVALWKDEWRSGQMGAGELFVMMAGISEMQTWCVSSWASTGLCCTAHAGTSSFLKRPSETSNRSY